MKSSTSKFATSKFAGNRNEHRAQALSWLVSQLRWEETLGDLRHHKHDAGEVRQAA
jgi:hypothetical protein